jgi:hypothetical protein
MIRMLDGIRKRLEYLRFKFHQWRAHRKAKSDDRNVYPLW